VLAILGVTFALIAAWLLAAPVDNNDDDFGAPSQPRGAAPRGARPTSGGVRKGGSAGGGDDSLTVESPRSHAAITARTQADQNLALLFEGCPREGVETYCGTQNDNTYIHTLQFALNSLVSVYRKPSLPTDRFL
jgi:hypothetical protein